MNSRLTLVLSVAAVLLCQAHGLPKDPSPDSQRPPLEQAVEETKKTSSAEEKTPLKTSQNALGTTKLKVHFPEDSKQVLALKEEENESVRMKKSASQREMFTFGHGPRATKVCIEVFSDHHPQVICGPPAEEAKKEEPPLPATRYAYEYPRAAYNPPPPTRYVQQPPLVPTRVSPYPMRRTEEEIPKPVTPSYQPASVQAQYPVRVISSPPPNPLFFQRQYLQPVISQSLIAPTQPLLRLNCGVQPDSGHYINSPLLRSSSSMLMGYYPVGEEVISGPTVRSSIGGADPLLPRAQYSFASPYSARMAADVGPAYAVDAGMAEGPYAADPWTASAFQAEDGRMYLLDAMQGRSAGDEEMAKQQYMTSMGYPESSTDDDLRKAYFQQEELRQYRQRLRELQGQLRNAKESMEDSKNFQAADDAKDSTQESTLQDNAHKKEATKTLNIQAKLKSS